MPSEVQLIGLDFGTTTSSAVIASALLTRNTVTGRTELTSVRERYRSNLVFTPIRDDRLDLPQVEQYLDQWLAAGQVCSEQVFGGGALLTGLTAQKENASGLVDLIRRRLGNALIATADDPCLESWLAFMGSCAGLSRAHPEKPVLNLDMGGGTTNLALGLNGEVLATGCLYVGARHIQVVPGTYRIVKQSRYARALLDDLGISKYPGDTLIPEEVDAVLDFYLRLLEGAARRNSAVYESSLAQIHEQVPLRLPENMVPELVTISGGVGELVYNHLQGHPWPPTTHFGDLGIDLARRLLESSFWSEMVGRFRPASCGRATVYGLLRHNTQISGSTLFLPHPEILPLADLPIFGVLGDKSSDEHWKNLVELVRRSPRGGGLSIEITEPTPQSVRTLGRRLAELLRSIPFPSDHPLVLFVPHNLGKVLGHYVTEWGTLPLALVVVDEITIRNAQYAHLGTMRDQVVPVSVYGLNE